MRAQAKLSSANRGDSAQREYILGRSSGRAQAVVFAVAASILLALLAAPASAAPLRLHEASFGTFTGIDPQALTVDQSNGDVYAISVHGNNVHRFDSSGAPKNFTAGPDAGTNTLTGNFYDFASYAQVAVDSSGGPSNGNIYVAEANGSVVKVFANDGTPLGALTGSGTPAGSFSGEPCGVAVDQANGDVYVASYEKRVWRYSPSAGTVTEADYSGGITTTFYSCQLAVASGSLYVHDWGEIDGLPGPLRKFATSAFATGPPPSPSSTEITAKSTAVATDPSNGDVYVDEGNKIAVFNSAGVALYTFGSAADFGTNSAGVAVKGAGGPAYVADRTNNQIDAYGAFSPPVIPPVVTTEAASDVKNVKATLNGNLDPNGGPPITDCYFEWGTSVAYDSIAPCDEGNSFATPSDVSAAITGLTPGTTYHFRLHVTTAVGEFSGSDQSFQATPASPIPVVVTGKGKALSATSASLEGVVNPNANPLTECRFEYVDDLAFQATGFTDLSSGGFEDCSPTFDSIPSDFEDHGVSATVTDLDPAKIYRFRLVASNANGTAKGVAALIPGPPLVETTGSPTRTATTARLDSRVSPHGSPTTYRFEYVTDDEFQASGFANAQSTPETFLGVNEVQVVTVSGSGTQFRLSFGGFTTPSLSKESSAGEIQAALRALPSIGSPNVSVAFQLTGNSTQSRYTVTFEGALANTDVGPLEVSVSASASASASVTTTTPGGPSAKEVQSVRIKATQGEFRLGFGADTTADLAYNSSSALVKAELEALPSIGAGSVSVSGGPGNDSGSTPYFVTFEGALANKNVAQLDISDGTPPLTWGFVFAEATTELPGGPSDRFALVSAEIGNLDPGTTYRYRVVAESLDTGDPVLGEDMTLTARDSDTSLSHGDFPWPPGSDRAWELVSASDSGGNPVQKGFAFSDDGDRAVYSLFGGNPGSEYGSLTNQLFAERTASGWKSSLIYPTRAQAQGNSWRQPAGRSDLSQLFAINTDFVSDASTVWRLSPGSPAQDVYTFPKDSEGLIAVSGDGSRIVMELKGSFDPDHPSSPSRKHLYDLTSGTPRLIDFLPDGSVADCGTDLPPTGTRAHQWISSDGSLVFFPSVGSTGCDNNFLQPLYVRDLDSGVTKPVSDGSPASFIRSTSDAVFFLTKEGLASEDTGGQDVYRYGLEDETLDCITCVASELNVDVLNFSNAHQSGTHIAVAPDGSRVYFTSTHRLLPGADDVGIYRVEVASGDLAYVAPGGVNTYSGDRQSNGSAITPDGSVFIFRSSSPLLNALNGTNNGGTNQYYRYDDTDRSLVCVSCPLDGGSPRGEVNQGFIGDLQEAGPNLTALSHAGDFAFVTPTALAPADQNTAGSGQAAKVGIDIYEWRDGRLLLVTDGLAPFLGGGEQEPQIYGFTPSGRDIFFTQPSQLTPDAIDAYERLYTARVGGGFDFPEPPPPCPLEVCQGTPKGAPDDPIPASGAFSGNGNVKEASQRRRCGKGRRKVNRAGKVRCVKRQSKQQKRRANHDRGTSR